jgi:hypothetical protein
VSAAVGARRVELAHEIWRRITASLPELRDDDTLEKLKNSSVAENVTTAVHPLEHRTAIENVDAPAAADEVARPAWSVHLSPAPPPCRPRPGRWFSWRP